MDHSLIAVTGLFDTIPLKKLPKNSLLLSRVDTKYTFSIDQLDDVLLRCFNDYSIVTVNEHRLCRYETKYYDSSDLSFYHHHHAGRANRLKVRLRRYVETENYFLEVKYRNNKGRTEKPRIPVYGNEEYPVQFLNNRAFDEVHTLAPDSLHESIQINYTRITLSSKNSAERVTIDTCLEFVNGNKKVTIPDLVIAEVKQDKSYSSPFKHIMNTMHLKQGSISKYCFGIMSLYNVKQNRFKETIRQIKKRTNYHVFSTDY